MSRKHFTAIANAFAAHRNEIPADAFRALVDDVADVCKQANPGFDRARFAAACEAPVGNR